MNPWPTQWVVSDDTCVGTRRAGGASLVLSVLSVLSGGAVVTVVVVGSGAATWSGPEHPVTSKKAASSGGAFRSGPVGISRLLIVTVLAAGIADEGAC